MNASTPSRNGSSGIRFGTGAALGLRNDYWFIDMQFRYLTITHAVRAAVLPERSDYWK
jgi:hypothetical protein